MGAWIEIYPDRLHTGLIIVAPLVGAWIEILTSKSSVCMISVAPLVGAWIEIIYILIIDYNNMSLPSWERGLKLL